MSHELKKQVEVIAAPWASSPYYDDAERWTHIFWSANSPFYQYFSKLNCQTVVELACGHGRHSELVAQRADKLYLLDVVADNIDFCRTRLARFQNIEYHINNGFNFEPIDANSVTAIFLLRCHGAFQPGRGRVLFEGHRTNPEIWRHGPVSSFELCRTGKRTLWHASPCPELHDHAAFRPICPASRATTGSITIPLVGRNKRSGRPDLTTQAITVHHVPSSASTPICFSTINDKKTGHAQ